MPQIKKKVINVKIKIGVFFIFLKLVPYADHNQKWECYVRQKHDCVGNITSKF